MVNNRTKPEPQPLAGLAAVENYLCERRSPHILWHTILNNHSWSRPHGRGANVGPSITACKIFLQRRWGGSWTCRLDVPHSFTPGDGLPLRAEVEARTQREAGELVCRSALAHLLMQNPSKVLLRPKHWTVPLEKLVAGLPGVLAEHQALPVHRPVRARAPPVHARGAEREAGVSAAEVSTEMVSNDIADILRTWLRIYGGEVDPYALRNAPPGLVPHDDGFTACLAGVVDKQADMAWRPKDPGQNPEGIIISWASSSGSSANVLVTDLEGTASGIANATKAWGDEAGRHLESSGSGGGTSSMGPAPSQWLDGVIGDGAETPYASVASGSPGTCLHLHYLD